MNMTETDQSNESYLRATKKATLLSVNQLSVCDGLGVSYFCSQTLKIFNAARKNDPISRSQTSAFRQMVPHGIQALNHRIWAHRIKLGEKAFD